MRASSVDVERAQGPHFWFTNHVANPVLRLALRSPLGRRLGRNLALVRYEGRRSGRTRQLVVQYARDGDTVWIVPADPARKSWWRNFRSAGPVVLRLAGRVYDAEAIALPASATPDGMATYLRRFPRAAKALGLDPATPGAGAEGVVIVRAVLAPAPAGAG